MTAVPNSPGSSSGLYGSSEGGDAVDSDEPGDCHDGKSRNSKRRLHTHDGAYFVQSGDYGKNVQAAADKEHRVRTGDDENDAAGHKKRKRAVDDDDDDDGDNSAVKAEALQLTSKHHDKFLQEPNSKRTKITLNTSEGLRQPYLGTSERLYGLTTRIWQQVFCFVPPVILGRCLRVSRSFNAMLTKRSSSGTWNQSQEDGEPGGLLADAIWISSRKRFAPGLPKPLQGQQELDLWRLLRGDDCQICRRRERLRTASDTSDPWRAGPGSNGVRVIWPFGVRSCGDCLLTHTEQEIDLLFSSTFPSFLLPALPCAFVSQFQDYVSSSALFMAAPPADVQTTKKYYKPHVEDIKRKFEAVRDLGAGSTEEWVKGLDAEGKGRASDALHWERWESKGGLRKINFRPVPKAVTIGLLQSSSTKIPTAENKVLPHSQQGPQPISASSVAPKSPVPQPAYPLLDQFPRPLMLSTNSGLPQRPPMQASQIRQERSVRDVNEARAARRLEIERRCMALEPCLSPDILCHMESFQAALQISSQFTDAAWEILKPRLLAQRESAETREKDRQSQLRVLQAQSEERKQHEASLREAKEVLDREWDAIQTPIRERVAKYADEIIETHWSGGAAVTKDACPKFAADVLLYVRRKFYEDVATNKDEQRCATEQPTGSVLSVAPLPQKLTLENMKWLYDNKIKGLTEQHQKELFLCNGCDGNSKLYGFEAVIQHFAAKHTNSLSLGSIVVHWRSEWPEKPPFYPDPMSIKASFNGAYLSLTAYAPGQPGNSSLADNNGRTAQNHSTFSNPSARHFPSTPSTSVHPAQIHPDGQPGQLPAPRIGQTPAPLFYQAQQSPTQFQAPLDPHYVPFGQAPEFTPYGPAPGFAPLRTPNVLPRPVPYSFMHGPPLHPPGGNLYQTQMNEMAKIARDVWFGTSGIKDIPQSVRIYVVIQHVISRFEQKYSNEPSLAMFLDGLNHNALMRPIRSLNGLVCKTCTSDIDQTGTVSHTHAPLGPSDRKLYTLPLLLNHFRIAHIERAKSTIDLQTGMESSKVDWKRDMVALPGTGVIANLIHAAGMDDIKLRLIVSVFPEVFPDPLPSLTPLSDIGLIPAPRPDDIATVNMFDQLGPTTAITGPLEESGTSHQSVHSMSLSSIGRNLQPSPRNSEPPGEDEYDPHRPAYLGRIVESHQLIASKDKVTQLEISLGLPGQVVSEYSQDLSPCLSQSRTQGAYGDKLLRHHDRSLQRASRSRRSTIKPLPEIQPIMSESKAAGRFLGGHKGNARGHDEDVIHSMRESVGRGITRSDGASSVNIAPPSRRRPEDLGWVERTSSYDHDLNGSFPVKQHRNELINNNRQTDRRAQYSDRPWSGPSVKYVYSGHGSPTESFRGYERVYDAQHYEPVGDPGRTGELPRVVHSRAMATRPGQSRNRSSSPQFRSHEPVQYRARSPADKQCYESVYQAPRSLQYAYAPSEGHHFDRPRVYYQDEYSPRVEYVPVRTQDYAAPYGHVIISRPPEIEHVRLADDFENQQLYESDGQLYYADQLQYNVRSRPERIDYQGPR